MIPHDSHSDSFGAVVHYFSGRPHVRDYRWFAVRGPASHIIRSEDFDEVLSKVLDRARHATEWRTGTTELSVLRFRLFW
jgi:hypothetical protein